MKNQFLYIAWGVMWIAVAIAIIYGIYITHRMSCLWFFLIPACVGFTSTSKNERNDDDE